MLLLQAAEAAHAVEAAAQGAEAGHGAAFHPVLPWLILGLPLLGFLINGFASIWAARRALPRVPAVGDPYWDTHGHDAHAHAAAPALALAHAGAPSEQEGLDVGVRPNPVDEAAADHAHDTHDDAHDAHDHPSGPRPWTHTLPSIVAPAAILGAFLIAVINFLGMQGAGTFEASRGWSWMPVGDLQVDFSLLLDPLSMVMTLIITGVGFLIHVFSIGYMKEDPGYPRYMAYLNL
ncbi:MAG: hypothetical protein KY467_10160, partial [Gemmatimonadetes bacterium]|nr:hypothetical protein [Gemmatimonadota bacterium]